MPGSFEKKVQEKMEELKLTPSAPLWDKIEAQLTPEKDRRKAWLWLPLLGLLLAGGGWWFFAGHENRKTDATASKQVETTNTPAEQTTTINPATNKPLTTDHQNTTSATQKTANNTSIPPVSVNQPTGQIIRQTEKLSVQKGGTDPTWKTAQSNKRLSSVPSGTLSVLSKTHKRHSTAPVTGQKIITGTPGNSIHATEPAIEEETSAAKSMSTEKAADALKGKLVSIVPGEKGKAEEAPSLSAQQNSAGKTDSAAQNKVSEKQILPVAADTAAGKRKIAAASRKWKLSLALQAGWQPASLANNSVQSDYFSSPLQNSSGIPPATTGSLSGIYGRPNNIQRGAAFTLGAGLTRVVSRRLEMSVGLQYTAFRFSTRVGSFRPLDTALNFRRQDVSVGGYYRNGGQEDYTFRYGVLETPVSLSYKLFSTLPLYFSGAASYGRLLKSNALTFDRLANVYYKNTDNLNRNLVSLSATLQYRIVNHPGFTLRAGPAVHYQLTHFHKDQSWTPGRLFVGLKTFIQL